MPTNADYDDIRYPGVQVTEVLKRISWGAVWAGVLIALGMEALFVTFGLFIGFSMYDWRAANPWGDVSAWSTAWYLVTAGWSMFFGAWCAARLAGNPTREAGILHGVTTWGLATIATIAIAAIASWSVLNDGITMLGAAAIATSQMGAVAAPATPAAHAAINQVQQNGPMAQATANLIEGIALRIWGGVLFGLVTALLGGWIGHNRTVLVESREIPPGHRVPA